jgi:ferredoxin/flavodoxin---NADP+ reductase
MGTFAVVAAEPLAPTLTRLEVHAPLVARKWKPGQFVIVRLDETGERIPLTIVDGSAEHGTVVLVVQAVGKSTLAITRLRRGDAFANLLGPLGQPTEIRRFGVVACAAGGVGAAELLPVARALRSAGNTVLTALGARSRDLLILEAEFAAVSERLAVTTDDGSWGRQGLVTAPLREWLDAAPGLSRVLAVGPLPMMRAVADLTRPYGVKTVASLNAVMVDGTGMCGGCRVSVGGRMQFACVDGPEFDAHEVDFQELMRRNRTYVAEERAAVERRSCVAAAAEEVAHVR